MSQQSFTIHAPQFFYQQFCALWNEAHNTGNVSNLTNYLKQQGIDLNLKDTALDTFLKCTDELLLKILSRKKIKSDQSLSTHQMAMLFGFVREVGRLRSFRDAITSGTKEACLTASVCDSAGIVQSALSCFSYTMPPPNMCGVDLKGGIDYVLGFLKDHHLYCADLVEPIDPISRRLRMDVVPPSLPADAEIIVDSQPLGIGGSAVVYKGRIMLHGKLLREVAVKIPKGTSYSEADAMKAFARDQRFLSHLQSIRGICRQFGVGMAIDGSFFAILELLSSERVSHRMERLSRDDAYLILWRVAQTLAALHSKDIVHLDIKPENLGMRFNGDVVLLDFGNAVDPTENEDRPICGHSYYLPPEIIQLWHNHRLNQLSDAERKLWDVWLFGMLAYQLLSKENHPYGIAPKDSDDANQVYRMAVDTYGAPARYEPLKKYGVGIPAEMEDWIQRCLSIDPNERYPDMEVVARACNKFLPYAPHREAYRHCTSHHDRFRVLCEWDESIFMNGDYDLQEEIFVFSEQIFQELEPSKMKSILMAEFHYRRARAYMRLGDKRNGQFFLETAEGFLEEEGLPWEDLYTLKSSILAEKAFYLLESREAIAEINKFEVNFGSLSPLYKARLQMAKMNALRKLKRFSEALETAVAAVDNFLLAKEPRKANETVAGIGNCLIAMERYSEAIVVLGKSCAIARDKFQNKGPNVDTLYINLGEALMRDGRAPEAIAVLEEARIRFPDSQNMIALLQYLSEAYTLNLQIERANTVIAEIDRREKMRSR